MPDTIAKSPLHSKCPSRDSECYGLFTTVIYVLRPDSGRIESWIGNYWCCSRVSCRRLLESFAEFSLDIITPDSTARTQTECWFPYWLCLFNPLLYSYFPKREMRRSCFWCSSF